MLCSSQQKAQFSQNECLSLENTTKLIHPVLTHASRVLFCIGITAVPTATQIVGAMAMIEHNFMS